MKHTKEQEFEIQKMEYDFQSKYRDYLVKLKYGQELIRDIFIGIIFLFFSLNNNEIAKVFMILFIVNFCISSLYTGLCIDMHDEKEVKYFKYFDVLMNISLFMNYVFIGVIFFIFFF